MGEGLPPETGNLTGPETAHEFRVVCSSVSNLVGDIVVACKRHHIRT